MADRIGPRPNWYAVLYGHHPGIHDNWDDCNAAIANFPGARWKGFAQLEDAQAWLNEQRHRAESLAARMAARDPNDPRVPLTPTRPRTTQPNPTTPTASTSASTSTPGPTSSPWRGSRSTPIVLDGDDFPLTSQAESSQTGSSSALEQRLYSVLRTANGQVRSSSTAVLDNVLLQRLQESYEAVDPTHTDLMQIIMKTWYAAEDRGRIWDVCRAFNRNGTFTGAITALSNLGVPIKDAHLLLMIIKYHNMVDEVF